MALFENFPYTNLHELNLDWIIERIREMEATSVLSVNGQTGYVILYQDARMELPEVTESQWSIIRTADGVEAGILFDSDGTAYIVKGQLFDQIYTHSNPPTYPVTSVNGLTGDVELFTEQYIRLPNLTDEQMTQWNFYRHINGITSGIQFADDGTAYIMNGNNRYVIYTQKDTPPYPVQSVNGQTGAVVLYQNANVVLPTVETGTSWSIKRTVNGTEIGLEFDIDGHCTLQIGQDDYPLYIEDLNFPSDFDDPAAVILELSDNLSAGTQWGIVRSIQNDDIVGIVFVYNSTDQTYEGFLKVNSTLTKLLTIDDIPSHTGVVSVNGLDGVVTLRGSDIVISSSDNRHIADAIATIETSISNVKNAIAYVEENDTASQNIPKNSYVIWKGSAYISNQAISTNDPLSSTNLTAITNGISNNLLAKTRSYEIRSVTYTYSVASGGRVHTNLKTLIDADMPSGKIFAGLAGWQSGDQNANLYACSYTNTAYSLGIHNGATSALSDVTATIYYLAI